MQVLCSSRPLPQAIRTSSAAVSTQEASSPTINKQRLVDTFLDLTTIEGPTRDERKVADNIKGRLAAMGLEAQEDDAGAKIGGNTGNLLVNIPGNVEGAPTLTFASHMDTVPFAVGCKPIIDGDIIRTDGSTALGGDCRAGCAELLEATQGILESNSPHGPIQLIFSVGEEGGLLGAYEFEKNKIRGDFVYALDGFAPNEVYVQGRHLLAMPAERPKPEEVYAGHQQLAHMPVKPPWGVKLTPAERKILDFTTDAMQDMGWQPKFHRIEFAASDANAFREKGLNAITLGAGENNDHTGEEFVRISEMAKSTQLVRQLVANAAALPARHFVN